MNFSKIDTMTETYDTVIDSLAEAKESHFITEENFYILHWLYRIRNASRARGIRIGFIQPDFLWVINRPMMRIKKLWRTNADIKIAADLWCTHRAAAEEQYGHISDWDVSSVTDMSGLFSQKRTFNDDISLWDVSNVTNMSYMFYCAHSFNQPIIRWNVSNVTNMGSMFGRAYLFNQPIGDWNVSNVTRMERMFQSTNTFNQHIGDWNVSNVRDMHFMFAYTHQFNQSIDKWDMSNVSNNEGMFFRD